MPVDVELPAVDVAMHLHGRYQEILVDIPVDRVRRIQAGIIKYNVAGEL